MVDFKSSTQNMLRKQNAVLSNQMRTPGNQKLYAEASSAAEQLRGTAERQLQSQGVSTDSAEYQNRMAQADRTRGLMLASAFGSRSGNGGGQSVRFASPKAFGSGGGGGGTTFTQDRLKAMTDLKDYARKLEIDRADAQQRAMLESIFNRDAKIDRDVENMQFNKTLGAKKELGQLDAESKVAAERIKGIAGIAGADIEGKYGIAKQSEQNKGLVDVQALKNVGGIEIQALKNTGAFDVANVESGPKYFSSLIKGSQPVLDFMGNNVGSPSVSKEQLGKFMQYSMPGAFPKPPTTMDRILSGAKAPTTAAGMIGMAFPGSGKMNAAQQTVKVPAASSGSREQQQTSGDGGKLPPRGSVSPENRTTTSQALQKIYALNQRRSVLGIPPLTQQEINKIIQPSK